jgi:ferric-dicitrate binding protein FerR (iron transport regulator)
VAMGMAVFKGDVIQTGRTSGAVLSFRNGDSATLAESSEVAMEWETSSTSLNLRQGVLIVQGSPRSASGRTSVHVLGATVIVQGEGEFPAICRIAALGRGAVVFNVHGRVEIHGAGAPFVLPSGKSAHLEAGGPQAAGQPAGKVSKELPEENVQHAKQTTWAALKTQDTVYWEDSIETLKYGRVQIQLLDGSTLNVGARSVLKVTKHDVANGQTAIEMTVGRMRADVVKITKPGGSFEVKTQTAVIGVVGTSLIIHATLNNTHVICLEGRVTVSSINATIGGVTSLLGGQSTNVPRGGPPGGAGQASTGELHSDINQTSVGEGGGGVSGAGAHGLGGLSTTGNALNAGVAGASAGAAGISGVAIARADSASNTISIVSSTLAQAAAASNSATSAANSANSASNATNTIVNSIIQSIPPPTHCGCQDGIIQSILSPAAP